MSKVKKYIKSFLYNNINTHQKINSRIQKLRLKFRTTKYLSYDSTEFKKQLRLIGIVPGDSVFVMHSQDRIYLNSGKIIPPNLILQDLLDYLGDDGNIMVLGFSLNRSTILSKDRIFDTKKTPTDCGIFAEILRRKRNSVRSLHPIFSAIAYGGKAEYFCSTHHQSPYPFDELSPYYKITNDRGKYLGLGVGFEAFTPCHMVDDHYKSRFKHEIYHKEPESFSVINGTGQKSEYSFLIRNTQTYPIDYDPYNYFDSLNIHYSQTITRSGIKIFSFKMKDFLNAAIKLYDLEKKTVWDTGNLFFTVSYKFKQLVRHLLR